MTSPAARRVTILIAIPNLLKSRAAAQSANAAASLRSLNTALTGYTVQYPTTGFPATIENLGGPSPCTSSATTACLMDDSITSAMAGTGFNSYSWTYAITPSGFTVVAAPLASSQSVRSYYLDQGGVTHYADSSVPNASSPVLGN